MDNNTEKFNQKLADLIRMITQLEFNNLIILSESCSEQGSPNHENKMFEKFKDYLLKIQKKYGKNFLHTDDDVIAAGKIIMIGVQVIAISTI